MWLDQYTNPNNWKAHYRTTAPAIASQFPQLDVLFVGAGTTGTLMGCARYFRQWHRPVWIVAVDSVGSVTFGGPPAPRMIPGLGTSVRPAQLDESFVDEIVLVEEADTVRACRRMARSGFLFGGSTGTVVSGATGWLAGNRAPGRTAVAIAPDLGERYLDTIYQDSWVQDLYGEGILGLRRAAQPVAGGMTVSTAWQTAGEHTGQALVDLRPRPKQRAVRLAEQPAARPTGPMSELILVDRHEAQGWRVRQDERLDNLFEERCDWIRQYGRPGQLAVDCDEMSLTYDELDARTNRLARYLRLHGAAQATGSRCCSIVRPTPTSPCWRC